MNSQKKLQIYNFPPYHKTDPLYQMDQYWSNRYQVILKNLFLKHHMWFLKFHNVLLYFLQHLYIWDFLHVRLIILMLFLEHLRLRQMTPPYTKNNHLQNKPWLYYLQISWLKILKNKLLKKFSSFIHSPKFTFVR